MLRLPEMSLEEQRTRDELKHKLLDLNQLHEQVCLISEDILLILAC